MTNIADSKKPTHFPATSDNIAEQYRRFQTPAEREQNRRTTWGKEASSQRQSANPKRVLGINLIKQALKDLEAKLYRDKDPDPDPMAWLHGEARALMDVETACKAAGVAVQRVRRAAKKVIEDADGSLEDRKLAPPEAFENHEDEWITCEEVVERYGLEAKSTVSNWVSDGLVNFTKEHKGSRSIVRVRVDDTLLGKVETYYQHKAARQ
jgi:hypothetical protein